METVELRAIESGTNCNFCDTPAVLWRENWSPGWPMCETCAAWWDATEALIAAGRDAGEACNCIEIVQQVLGGFASWDEQHPEESAV